MQTLTTIKDFFSQQHQLRLNAGEQDVYRYKINMVNSVIDPMGELEKQQTLASYFSRKITGMPSENLLFTEINIRKVNFDCSTAGWTASAAV